MFDNTFTGRSVLVTGHTGFKGSWLSIWLNELGATVSGLALEPHTNLDNYVVSNLDDHMGSTIGDIRDYDVVKDAFDKVQPEIVFHLAAQPIVRESYLNPKETLDTNVGGTVNILEAARTSESTEIIVVITSDKCYENRETFWGYRETDPMGGHDPYSASKGCTELVASAYQRSFFGSHANKVLATARAGNVIGGGDWQADRLIPDCIRALKSQRPIEIRNPWSTRPWQHVLEPLSGYLQLAFMLAGDGNKYASGWNFGPHQESIVPVREAVEELLAAWGAGEWKDVSGTTEHPHEANLLSLDISKARSLLGWQPKWTFKEAIGATADWYRQDPQSDMYRFCARQISKYSL